MILLGLLLVAGLAWWWLERQPFNVVLRTTLASDGYNAHGWACGAGPIFAVWRHGTTHTSIDGRIDLAVSSDGRAWTRRTVVPQRDGHDYRDPGLACASDRLILSYTDRLGDEVSYAAMVMHSDDRGQTWSDPQDVSPFSGWSFVEAAPLAMKSSVLLPVYGKNHGDRAERVAVLRSEDGGLSWPESVSLAQDYNETTLVQYDSSVVAFLRNSDTNHPRALGRAVSRDAGRSWTPVTELSFKTYPGRPGAVVFPGKGIILFYRRWPDAATVYRWSQDGGVSWSVEREWDPRTSEYAGGAAHDPKTIDLFWAYDQQSHGAEADFAMLRVP